MSGEVGRGFKYGCGVLIALALVPAMMCAIPAVFSALWGPLSKFYQEMPTAEKKPELELISHNLKKTSSSLFVNGKVRNIGNRSINGVVAVVDVYNENGKMISSTDSLINDQTIIQGQESEFSVKIPNNGLMKKYTITFKAFGGGEIKSKDSSKENKKGNKKRSGK